MLRPRLFHVQRNRIGQEGLVALGRHRRRRVTADLHRVQLQLFGCLHVQLEAFNLGTHILPEFCGRRHQVHEPAIERDQRCNQPRMPPRPLCRLHHREHDGPAAQQDGDDRVSDIPAEILVAIFSGERRCEFGIGLEESRIGYIPQLPCRLRAEKGAFQVQVFRRQRGGLLAGFGERQGGQLVLAGIDDEMAFHGQVHQRRDQRPMAGEASIVDVMHGSRRIALRRRIVREDRPLHRVATDAIEVAPGKPEYAQQRGDQDGQRAIALPPAPRLVRT